MVGTAGTAIGVSGETQQTDYFRMKDIVIGKMNKELLGWDMMRNPSAPVLETDIAMARAELRAP